jgi:hypothetical protein
VGDVEPEHAARRRAARDHPAVPGAQRRAPPGAHDANLDALLEFLKRTRGIDFTGYERPSVERRFRRRPAATPSPRT